MNEALKYLFEVKKLYGGKKDANLRKKRTNIAKQAGLG